MNYTSLVTEDLFDSVFQILIQRELNFQVVPHILEDFYCPSDVFFGMSCGGDHPEHNQSGRNHGPGNTGTENLVLSEVGEHAHSHFFEVVANRSENGANRRITGTNLVTKVFQSIFELIGAFPHYFPAIITIRNFLKGNLEGFDVSHRQCFCKYLGTGIVGNPVPDFGGCCRIATDGGERFGESTEVYIDFFLDSQMISSSPAFFAYDANSMGIIIVNAYGMTECAPGILSRTLRCNTFGSTGIPFDNTEVELRSEEGRPLGTGEKGVLFTRGPQVMAGYYKNPQATTAVLDDKGWLNTGDLAVRSENGEFIIVGRMKDTIVLMGGENVEPEPIEDKMKESLYIDHAVVLGQDQKQLSAIVAVNEEELMKLAGELKLSPTEVMVDGLDSIENDSIYLHLMKEVNILINRDQGFKPFEFVTKIFPVRNDFSVGKELTQTLKVKRQYITEKYKGMINKLMHDVKKK